MLLLYSDMATVQDLQNLRDVLVCGVVGGALSEKQLVLLVED